MRARPEHEVAYQDLVALVSRHAHKMTSLEVLAVAANMVGKLVAMQDQRIVTSAHAMKLIADNIELGNSQVLRGMACSGKRWPFASVDSTDIARNHNRDQNTPRKMADRAMLGDMARCGAANGTDLMAEIAQRGALGVCSWCGTDSAEAAQRHEGPHARWCVHFRESQRGGQPRLKYAALIERLRKRAALAAEIGESGIERDILDAIAALGKIKET